MYISKKELVQRKKAGLIKSLRHPDLPLIMWNYTPKCTFKDRAWDYYTMMARGLVTSTTLQSTIISHPFKKFFNVGERDATMPSNLPLNLPFEATEKVDGSMIEVYGFNGKLMCHTRGSWDNEQSMKARVFIKETMDTERLDDICCKRYMTLVFEITYIGNGVVVYDRKEPYMHLLGALSSETGADLFYDDLSDVAKEIRSPIVHKYDDMEINDLMSFNDPGIEGFVVRFADGLRVKIKTQ